MSCPVRVRYPSNIIHVMGVRYKSKGYCRCCPRKQSGGIRINPSSPSPSARSSYPRAHSYFHWACGALSRSLGQSWHPRVLAWERSCGQNPVRPAMSPQAKLVAWGSYRAVDGRCGLRRSNCVRSHYQSHGMIPSLPIYKNVGGTSSPWSARKFALSSTKWKGQWKFNYQSQLQKKKSRDFFK